jgi:hypothetical protein
MATSTKYYSRISTSNFTAVQQDSGLYMITYIYPAGRKISAVLNDKFYKIVTDIDSTQRNLKWVKEIIKNKNLG